MQNDFERRALAAFFSTGGNVRPGAVATHSIDGREYITLRDDLGSLLACYRVRNDGRLKRLKARTRRVAEVLR